MSLHYEEPYTVTVKEDYERNRTEVTVSMVGTLSMSKYGLALMAIAAEILGIERASELPRPNKVIINDPATVILWSDGTKTVSKCQDDDEYDPLFGIIACVVRKLGLNRVKVDAWEWVIEFLANNLADADECRFISDVLATVADAWDLDGVDEAMEPYSKYPGFPIEKE